MVALLDGDVFVVFLGCFLRLFGTEEVRLEQVDSGSLVGRKPTAGRREVAVDAHIVVGVLVALLRVDDEFPVTLHAWQSEGVTTQRVGHRGAFEVLSVFVVEVHGQVHTIHRVLLFLLPQFAKHIELVLDGLGEPRGAVVEERVALILLDGTGHQGPVVATPTLHQHQQVGCQAVLFVVGLEVIAWVGYVALDVAAEQEPREGIPFAPVGHGGGIDGREGKVAVGLCLYIDGHGLAGSGEGLRGRDADGVSLARGGTDEELTLGLNVAIGCEESELAHASLHREAVEGQHHGTFGIDGVGLHHSSVVHQGVAQQLAHHRRGSIDGGFYSIVLQHVHLHGQTFLFGTGQTHIVGATLSVGQTQIARGVVGFHGEHAPTLANCLDSTNLLLLGIEQTAFGLEAGSRLVGHQEGHPVGQALDEFAAFGIEAHLQAVLLVVLAVVHAHIGQTLTVAVVVHHHLGVVAILGRCLEHREHSREDAAIAPVGHVASVGAHLVEARRVEAVEFHVAVCRTVLDGQLACDHHIARRVDQFHIQHRTHVGRLARVGPQHVALEPDSLAHEVTRVVKMEIHLLLRHGLRKVHSPLHVGDNPQQFAVAVLLSHHRKDGQHPKK